MLLSVTVHAKDWLTLNITGVNTSLKKNIVAHLGTLPKSSVQRRAYLFNAKDNITAALQSMGYYHSLIKQKTIQNKKAAWVFKIEISLGKPTRLQWIDIRIEGELLEDPVFNQWLNQLKIRPGDILNQGTYEQMKSQLISMALARGYFDGQYTQSQIIVNRDLNLAKINLYYASGVRYHFGDVTFEGSTLEPKLLTDLIPFKSGDPYSSTSLNQLNQKLLNTGYFSNIQVLPLMTKAKDDRIPIDVNLSPRPNHSIKLGLGADIGNTTNNTIEPRVSVTWQTPQINRYGHSQTTTAQWSLNRPKLLSTYSIPLTDPLDDLLKIRFGIIRDYYGITQEYSTSSNKYYNTGQLDSTQYLIGVARQRRLKDKWVFSYSIEALKEKYNQSDVNYDPFFILFGTSLSKIIRGDNSLDPKSGSLQSYSVSYADPELGSTIRLLKMEAKFKWIKTFFTKHRFVSRLDLGINYTDDSNLAEISPSLRFFAGGDQSIRGYSYNELGPYIDYTDSDGNQIREVVGGRYLIVGSLEYQYYFTPTWRAAAFIDAGNAYDTGQFDPVVSVGPGIAWISPIGPISLDLGIGLQKTDTLDRPWRIHIMMGSEI
ncbi:autotransporter assembly complex protein TamA [Shewanella surugensis]|uniref:Translocation and assembly module subunit TamA n=1 Tax=Shewanella surugensis TaxID=212020 RepID=A0ABT0L6S5_9GAMM|nr:autotransporter assembly complex family protein [Shewanella surugensis]MCL1123373.1 autotransporter assembly complex protein TamA [Shewanella surugensis]